MNKRTILRILIVALITLLPLTAASPAYADTPEFEVITFDDTYPTDTTCDFEILSHFYGELGVTYFYDENVSVRSNVRWGKMNLTYSANNKHLDVHIQGTIHNESPSATIWIYKTTGIVWDFVTVPGYGNVRGSAGQFSAKFVFSEDGQLVDFVVIRDVGVRNPDDWGPICEYLAP